MKNEDTSMLQKARERLSLKDYDKTYARMVLEFARASEEGETEREEALKHICGTMVMMGEDALTDSWAISDRLIELYFETERYLKGDSISDGQRKELEVEKSEIEKHMRKMWSHEKTESEMKKAILKVDTGNGRLLSRINAVMEEMESRAVPGDFHYGHVYDSISRFFVERADTSEIISMVKEIASQLEELEGDTD
jgi:hypothetical protein